MIPAIQSFKQGDRVVVPKGGPGFVAYVGETEFAAGTWVGIILDEPNGKNDGSVNGKRYFTCRSASGMFVRSSQVTLLSETRPSRPSTGLSKTPARPLPTTTAGGHQSLLKPVTTTTIRTSAAHSILAAKAKQSSAPGSPRLSNISAPASPKIRAVAGKSYSTGAIPPATPTSRPAGANLTRMVNRNPLPPLRGSVPSTPTLNRRTSTATAPSANQSTIGTNVSFANKISSRPSSVTLTHKTNSLSSVRSKPAPPSAAVSGRPPDSTSTLLAYEQDDAHESHATAESPSLFEEDPLDELCGEEDLESSPLCPIKLRNLNQPKASRPPTLKNLANEGMDQTGHMIPSAGQGRSLPSNSALKSPELPGKTPTKAFNDSNLASPHPNTVATRVYEELVTKYKLLEVRRNEDREKLRELEKAREENESWNNVTKPKLQTKLNECLEELKTLRKLNKDLEASRLEAENRLADFSDEVELATLDKEMAEEKLDQTEVLMVGMKEELETLKVEMSALKEVQERIEASESGECDQSTTLKLIQLEKQNHRLKEALARMRDLSQEADLTNRKRIADLEQELDLSAELQGEYSVILRQLEVAETQVEDLKQQLDASMGAEDMLEQLTERNLTLNEKIDDMKAIIEDLEALKDLADELEDDHVETEKQMQEEIDYKDLQLRDQRKRNERLEESVADYENTILQFRELVLSLQTDLDVMREREQLQHHESRNLASQTQAMLNLNRKLQSSSVKGQVKAIDLELGKLESKLAILQCTIMKPYLLPSYFEGDHDAVESLMFFTRIASKTDLVSSVIEQTNHIGESLSATVTEVVVIACEARSKLARLSALSSRFAAFIRSCPPESFIKMGGVYQELLSAEKKIDGFIDACKREELKEIEVAREVDRFLPQMRHLAELYLTDTEYDVAELQTGEINTLDVDLDAILACIGFAKQTITTIQQDGQTDPDVDIADVIFRPLQNLSNQARTAKVISKKLLRRLQDLTQQSCSLNPNHSNAMTVLKENTYDLANVSSRLADLVGRYCSELRSSKEVFLVETYNDILQEATRDIVKHTGRPLEEFFTLLSHLARDLGITLGVATDPEHVARNVYEHPWIIRVTEIRSSAAINVDAELKVSKLKEEVRELIKDLRSKDHSLQESQVKIQVMEKRMEAVKKQADAMAELEANLRKAEKEAKQYEELNESLQNEYDKVEEQNKELKTKLATSGPDTIKNAHQASVGSPKSQPGFLAGQDFYVPYEGNLETTQLVEQIESLRGATKFLRAENSYLKSQTLLKQLNTLPSYSLSPPAFPPIISDTSEDDYSPISSSTERGKSQKVGSTSDQIRKLTLESKKLYNEALDISINPQVVDLTMVKRRTPNPALTSGTTKVWQLRERLPQAQFDRRKEEVERLRKKIEAFKQRTHNISAQRSTC